LTSDKKEIEPITLEGHKREVTCVAFTADGKQVLSASQDKLIKLWDVDGEKVVQVFEGHKNWVTALAISPDGKLLLPATDDLSVKVWDTAKGKEVDHLDLRKSSDFARSLAFAPKGPSFAVGTASWVVLRFELKK